VAVDKNNSFKKLAELFDLHVKFLILLGETADEIERAAKLAQFDKYAKVNSLREAVDFAKVLQRVAILYFSRLPVRALTCSKILKIGEKSLKKL